MIRRRSKRACSSYVCSTSERNHVRRGGEDGQLAVGNVVVNLDGVFVPNDVVIGRQHQGGRGDGFERLHIDVRLFELSQLDELETIHAAPIEEVYLDRWSTGAWSSSAMPRTRPRPTWPRARRWRSRMRSSWRPSYQRQPRRQRRSARLCGDGRHVSVGSSAARTAVIGFARCRHCCGIWRSEAQARRSTGQITGLYLPSPETGRRSSVVERATA